MLEGYILSILNQLSIAAFEDGDVVTFYLRCEFFPVEIWDEGHDDSESLESENDEPLEFSEDDDV